MLKLLCIVVLTTSIPFLANAKEERTQALLCAQRVPKIEINRAMQLAINAFSKLQPTEDSYMDFVSLECKQNKQYWVVGFRRRAYETGHLLVYIDMNGKTEVSVVKDG